jgi:hypothetical protein
MIAIGAVAIASAIIPIQIAIVSSPEASAQMKAWLFNVEEPRFHRSLLIAHLSSLIAHSSSLIPHPLFFAAAIAEGD